MKKRIAINGFGRIGRLTLRNLMKNKNVEVVGINDLTDTATLAHLFEFDTSHRRYDGTVSTNGNNLVIDGNEIKTTDIRNPAELPWKELQVDVVLECTGFFRTTEKAMLHIEAGAKKVVLSAPAKSEGIPTIVIGVNHNTIKESDLIVSNASCTTNCLASLVKVIDENWGIQSGFMSTVHAYTSNQNIQDAPHSDLRRARAAAENIIPTTTGAAKALALVIPSIKGKIFASCIRVPVPTGSIVELTVQTDKEVSVEAVNEAFKKAAENDLKGVLEYTDKPLVSSDIVSNPHTSIFDSLLTEVHQGQLKVTAWYDNEAGYSAKLAAMAELV
jgi:glyceraldehyde 3-phosphate dehydrogenase